MKSLRLPLTYAMSAALTLALGPAVALAQTPGTIAAGVYTNDSNEAGFSSFDPVSGSFVGLEVFHNVHRSQPQGGPPTTTETTQMSLNVFGNTFFGSGCYDIPATDFAFSSGSATLHAQVTADTTNCGGPPGTFPTPFTIDATWTGNAPVTGGRNLTTFDCGGYALEELITSQLQGASATLSISPIFGSPFSAPEFQLLRSDHEAIQAQGVQPDGCQPTPGIPGGAGPPPAGDYVSDMTLAGASFFDPTTGSFAFFNVTRSTLQSDPKNGTATTAVQFQVNFNINAGGQFLFGCFQLSPADFSNNGVTSAMLSLNIDQNTPTCFGAPWTLPPQTLNVTWSGIAPVATSRSEVDFTCLTYHLEGAGLTTTSRAAATATLAPMISTPFTTPDQGSLETSTSQQHAEGAQQPVCHL